MSIIYNVTNVKIAKSATIAYHAIVLYPAIKNAGKPTFYILYNS